MASNFSFTEKGALQYSSAMNPLVDFFRSAASQRSMVMNETDNIIELFTDAYGVNKEIAFKLAFWLRDPRSGAGERLAARKIFNALYKANKQSIIDNLDILVKYGYWKDLLIFALDPDVIKFWVDKIKSGDALAAKWAPRLHSKYHVIAQKMRDELGLTNKQYRLMLKENSNTVEQLMCKNYWKDIKYSHVPSLAIKKYKNTFDKHDNERFNLWKNDTSQKAHASVLYPHEVMKVALNEDEILGQKLWDNLPDFIKEGERIMPIVDVSGSMMFDVIPNISALLISISLGIYLSEKNKSKFKNTVITFSDNPTFIDFDECKTLTRKYHKILSGNWGMSTDFEKSYSLILNTAIKYNVPQSKMPTMLLVLSDMQFDEARTQGGYWSTNRTPKHIHMNLIKEAFKQAGYIVPKLVFWNLNESYTGSPATSTSKDVALVSGFSPSIMKAVLNAEEVTPIDVLLEAIEPYNNVKTDNLPDLDDFILSASEPYSEINIENETMVELLGNKMLK